MQRNIVQTLYRRLWFTEQYSKNAKVSQKGESLSHFPK